MWSEVALTRLLHVETILAWELVIASNHNTNEALFFMRWWRWIMRPIDRKYGKNEILNNKVFGIKKVKYEINGYEHSELYHRKNLTKKRLDAEQSGDIF
jgi:hypothetical protein